MTEAVAVPLFLITITFLLSCLINRSIADFYKFLLVLLILNLVRGQFLFFFPITLLVVIYFYRAKIFTKSVCFKLLMLSLSVFLISNLMTRSYHLVVHDEFINTPFTGIQLAANSFYVSDFDDYRLFENTDDQIIVKKILDSAKSNNLLLKTVKLNNPKIDKQGIINHYNIAYNELAHHTIKAVLMKEFEDLSRVNKWVNIDNKTLYYSYVLIINNLEEFLYIYKLNLEKNYFVNFFNILIFISILTMSTIFTFWNNSRIGIFLSLSSFLILFNILLVALVEPLLWRYVIYTNIVFGVCLITLIDCYFMKYFDFKSHEEG